MKKIFFIFAVFFITPCNSKELHGEVLIASFATSILNQEQSVRFNIGLAAAKINGITVYPGEIFSFNNIVGEASASKGFKTGRVLYEDRVSYESGGGVCQVSSTLFNAFLLAGCTIIERHRHQFPVSYVPPGLDATIKFGKKDLRIKNPHSCPIIIKSLVNESSLIISIFASENLSEFYEVWTEADELTMPLNNDSDKKIRNAMTIYVYRRTLKEGKTIKTSLLYKDFYPPYYID